MSPFYVTPRFKKSLEYFMMSKKTLQENRLSLSGKEKLMYFFTNGKFVALKMLPLQPLGFDLLIKTNLTTFWRQSCERRNTLNNIFFFHSIPLFSSRYLQTFQTQTVDRVK